MTANPTYEELKQRVDELEKEMTYYKFIEADIQKSEGSLEAVFFANPDPVIVYDEKRLARHINPEFLRVFGWSLDELVGRRIPFIPENQEVLSDSKFKELYETEKPVRFESKRLTKSGNILDVLISAAVIKDSRGLTIGVVSNLTDITRKNIIDAQLRQAHKIDAINTLIGGIAHKFNNLLYIIYGNAELLMVKAGDKEKIKLKKILHSTEDGVALIKQLLTFTHNAVSNLQNINLNFEINRINESLENSISKMVEIKKDLADNLYTISADQRQIEQVLADLCFNAAEAMPDGGNLTIKTENCIVDDSFCADYPEIIKGWCVKLSISDTGHGMDKETQKRIFDPFFTTKKTQKNSGLGLSVIYGIIKSHNGLILCESKPGAGTTFAIYLPAFKEIESSESPSVHAPALSSDKQTVLIVDDEQSVLGLIQKMATILGYKTITADSGENALNKYYAAKDQIALILLDLSMPGMGGEICLEKLIEFDPDVKVIIASGYFEKVHIQDMINNGAKDYIVKPFSRADLSKVMQKVLH